MDETHSLNINSVLSWLNVKLRMCKGDINASGGKMMRFLAVCDVCEFAVIVFFFFFLIWLCPQTCSNGQKTEVFLAWGMRGQNLRMAEKFRDKPHN